MKRIIAGRFQTKDNADAVAALIARYIDTAEIRIVRNNPPGQHDAFAVGEDEDEGVMLSVRITNPVSEERVIATLRAAGAADIEPDHGEWRDGDWANFTLVAAPRLVANLSN